MARRTRTGILARFAIAAGIAIATGVGPAHAIIDIPPLQQPNWSELTPQQQEILKPLAGEWNSLEAGRRKKWVGIAQRYPSMNAEEKNRVQQNMLEWVRLTPAQRKQARENFRKNLHNAPPEQQQAVLQKWQSYRELPSEEKERLRLQAQQKKTLGKPPESKPSGAMSPQHHLQAIRKPAPGTAPQPETSAATATPAASQLQPSPPVGDPAAAPAASP